MYAFAPASCSAHSQARLQLQIGVPMVKTPEVMGICSARVQQVGHDEQTWFVAAVHQLNCSFDELQQVCELQAVGISHDPALVVKGTHDVLQKAVQQETVGLVPTSLCCQVMQLPDGTCAGQTCLDTKY